MELSQAEIIQKPKLQELSSLFMTHRLSVMQALEKFHEYISYGLGIMARTVNYMELSQAEIIQKPKNARVVFLVHDTSSQCDVCTCEVS